MAKITLKEPSGPYSCVLNTEAMETKIEEAFLGVGFVSASGETLAVSMRDNGFEIIYGEGGETRFFEFKGGEVKESNVV